MKIFAIETSCDETACAVVENGVNSLASVISSSKELHEETGGIVPEIAARKQIEFIVPVIAKTIEKFGGTFDDIDSFAVTVGPGLIGSLLIGVEAAKTLAFVLEKPLIPVNHLVGHIYANWINNPAVIEFPAVVLVVSGGHTDLVLMRGHGELEFLGGTLDDAAGEAFDKTARLLGLAKYLGGVQLSNLAASCTHNTLVGRLPRPMLDKDNYDFSFSGLKTAVKRLVELENFPKDVIACEFETAVVDVLVSKTFKAAKEHKVKSILLGGGVSANKLLRSRLTLVAKEAGFKLHIPDSSLCTDNAVYIAGAAYFNNNPCDITDIKANPSLDIMGKL